MTTSPAETEGDTPVLVAISPKTSHGWRPISVKIQPKLLPKTGSSGVAMMSQCHQRAAGTRSRRVAHRTAAAAAIAAKPTPIMRRKDQYDSGMFGTYVASSTSGSPLSP